MSAIDAGGGLRNMCVISAADDETTAAASALSQLRANERGGWQDAGSDECAAQLRAIRRVI